MSPHHHGIAEEHPRSHPIQFWSAVLVLIVWALDSFYFNFFEEFTRPVPTPIRLLLFTAFLITGLYLIRSSHGEVFGVLEPQSTVTTGPYAFVRHPMYLGTLLILTSPVLLAMSIISLIPLLAAFFLYNMLAAYEERELERVLGANYKDYKKRVPRWIPNPLVLIERERLRIIAFDAALVLILLAGVVLALHVYNKTAATSCESNFDCDFYCPAGSFNKNFIGIYQGPLFDSDCRGGLVPICESNRCMTLDVLSATSMEDCEKVGEGLNEFLCYRTLAEGVTGTPLCRDIDFEVDISFCYFEFSKCL